MKRFGLLGAGRTLGAKSAELTLDQLILRLNELRETASGVPLSAEMALRSPTVYAIVNLVRRTIGHLPLDVVRVTGDTREPQPDHEVARIFNRRPNQWQSPFQFKAAIALNQLLHGNFYAQKQKASNNKLVNLVPISPPAVTVSQNDTGYLAYEVAQDRKDRRTLTQRDVFHVRDLSLDGIVGCPFWRHVSETVALEIAAEKFGAAFFGGGSLPIGVIEHPAYFRDEETRKKFSDSWKKIFQSKKRGTPVLEGGLKFSPLQYDNEKSQFLEVRKHQREVIAGALGIPPHMVGALERCMPADTLVFTKSGPRRIAEVCVGDEVWSPTPHGVKLHRVLRTWDNGERDILKIRTSNRTVSCTVGHRLLVRRQCERPLNPGETGGRNVEGAKRRVFWRDEYVPAGHLRAGDTLVALGRLPGTGRSVAPNGRKLSLGFMEICGLLLADGGISYDKGRPAGVAIARGSRATYMDAYRAAIRDEFVRYDGGNGRGNQAAVALSVVTLQEQERQTVFRSVLAANELVTLGFAGTAYTKRVPGWVFETTEDLRLAFLRGFLDGDGTVDAKGRITFYSASKTLLDDVRHLCMASGIPVTNSRSDINSPAAFGHGTRVFRFTCSDPGENRRIGSHDTRYQTRLAAGRPFARKNRAYPRFGGKAPAAPGTALSRIVSIEQQPAQRVFDLEVENAHSFFADGVGSHNSTNNNIEQQALELIVYFLTPLLVNIEQQAAIDLLSDAERDSLQLKFNVGALLRGDRKSRSEALKIQRENGIINANEWRALEDMAPIEGPAGERYLLPLNMTDAARATDANDDPDPDPAAEPAEDEPKKPAKAA